MIHLFMRPSVSVEKMVGAYKVVVTGAPEELEALVRTLDEMVTKLAEENPRVSAEPSSPPPSTSFPQLSGSLSAADAIQELFASDWGRHPRKIGEIQEALAVNGLHYPVTSLSGKLLKLKRKMVLQRFKVEQGYAYTAGPAIRARGEDLG